MKLNDHAVRKARDHLESLRGLLQSAGLVGPTNAPTHPAAQAVGGLSAATSLAYLGQFLDRVEAQLGRKGREEETE